MLRCLIVDDEPHAIEVIKNYSKKTPYLEIVASFNSALEALPYIEKEDIDLIFLDINMPTFTGLDFVKSFGNKTNIILTTAYSNYAVTAFDNDVIDYLLKPFPFERFLVATQKALNRLYKPIAEKAPVEIKETEHQIFVKTDKGKIIKIDYNDIIYIEGLKNYISFYLTNKRRVISLLNMKTLEDRLPAQSFVRIHKSYLISINKIISMDGGRLYLEGAEEPIPIGNTFKALFIERLKGKFLS